MAKAAQMNCPKCGKANTYDPRFVARQIQCVECGQSFTPGFGRLQGNYVPPLAPPSRPNGIALASVICGILFWPLWAMGLSMPVGLGRVAIGVAPLFCSGLAITLGILGLIRTRDRRVTGRGYSIAGMALGVVNATLLAMILLGVVKTALGPQGTAEKSVADTTSPPAGQSAAAPVSPVTAPVSPVTAPAASVTAPAAAGAADASAPQAQPYVFGDINVSFDSPPDSWIKMDAKKVNPLASAAFHRMFPEMYFILIVERPEFPITSDKLADFYASHVKKAADDCQTQKRQAKTIAGIDGVKMNILAQLRGYSIFYSYWMGETHGYCYELVTYGSSPDQAAIEGEADMMEERFHQIDPNRQATPQASPEPPLATFDSPDFGISMDLTGLGWQRSPRTAKALPSAILTGTRPPMNFFTLQAFPLGDLAPPMDYVAAAACRMHELSFGDATHVEHSSEGSVQTCKFELHSIHEGFKWVEFYEVIRRPGYAYLLRGWSGVETELPNLRSLANQIHLHDAATGSDAVANDDFKKSEAHLLNAIGLQFENQKQFGTAATYFAKAFDYFPEAVILGNLIGADELTGNFSDALVAAKRGVQLWPGDVALQARQARIQVRLKDFKGGATTFAALFAGDYRDDDSFHEYLLVLQKLGKVDDAIAAAGTYLAKSDSEPISIDQALLYDGKGDHDRAIQLLRAKWNQDPSNMTVGANLAMVLVEAHQYSDGAKIAQQLISAGDNDADIYLVLGQAQFGLTWYRQAKDSFEAGQQKAPDNPVFGRWIDVASAKLGEGDNSSIQTRIEPVAIPTSLLSDDPAHPLPAVDVTQDACYLRRITAISFVPKDHFKTSEYRLIKVLSQSGVDSFSKMQFAFDGVAERIYLNKLEVRDDQGKVVATTDGSDCFVTDENEAQSHSFRKVLNIPVKGLKAGDTMELLVTRQDISPPAEMEYSVRLFGAEFPVGLEAVYLTGATDAVKSQQSAGLSAQNLEGGLCWSMSPAPLVHAEAQEPPADEFLPYVALGDKGATWEAVGREYLDEIAPQLQPDSAAATLSGQLTAGLTSDAQKVAAIVKYVQHNFTYTAIEFGRRARVPNMAGDVIHNKYGDCKDHAVLLVQLLRAASIPANLALANFDQSVQADLPSIDQFTHVIVCVPSIMPNGFFDCTNKLSDVQSGVPMGLGKHKVLLLDPAQPRLIEIPDYPADAFAVNGSRAISISDSGSASVEEELSLNGTEAASFRYFFNSLAPAARLDQMQEFMAGRGAAVVMHDLKIDNLDDASQPLGVKLSYTIKNCFNSLSDRMVGTVPSPLARYWLQVAPVDHRLTPFKYYYPMRLKLSTKIDLPSGYSLDESPKPASISDPYTSAQIQFDQAGGSLTETAAMKSDPFDHSAADYGDFEQSREKLIESLEPAMELVKR